MTKKYVMSSLLASQLKENRLQTLKVHCVPHRAAFLADQHGCFEYHNYIVPLHIIIIW